MALNFPDPATQTPVNTWSPTSTPSASTNGLTYLWDGEKWTTEGGVPNLHWTRTGSVLSPTNAGDDVQIASLNSGPLAGLRNLLIGNFYVWQRSVSETIPAAGESYLTADRWVIRGTSLTGGAVISSRAYVESNKYQALRFTVTSPTTSHLSTYQKVEAINCRQLAGKEVTFSVYATNFTPVLTVGYRDNADAIQFVAGTTNSLGSNRFSTTVTLPDVQFGSDFDEIGLELFIQTPLNTAVANGQYNIWHPQLEPGPVATPFEQRPIGLELSLAQRYYQNLNEINPSGVGPAGLTQAQNTTRMVCYLPAKVSMRVAPSVGLPSTSQYQLQVNDANFGQTDFVVDQSCQTGVFIIVQPDVGNAQRFTAGGSGRLFTTNAAAKPFTADAEL